MTIVLIMLFYPLIGQNFEEMKEWFTWYPNRRAVEKDSTLYKSKLITAPILSFAPETSVGIGIGAKYIFKFKGSGDETRTSNMPLSLRYTFNNQFIFYSGFEVFTNQERYVFTGNLLFQNYPRLYYGLGRDSNFSNEQEYNYYQLLVEPIVLKQVGLRYLFVGGGLRYNQIYNVSFDASGILDAEQPNGYLGSRSVGVEIAVLYDSRNNILNAQNGWYLEFTYGFYDEFLGSTHQFQLTRFDLRHYLKLFRDKKDILAFQFLGHFSHKDIPFSELALLGGGEMLRGYTEGRFIDRNMLATQVEYRKTFKSSRFGYVVFVGAGNIFSNFNNISLSNVLPNFGAGLRFTIDRKEKLNLRLDYGLGEDTSNVYFNIAEAF